MIKTACMHEFLNKFDKTNTYRSSTYQIKSLSWWQLFIKWCGCHKHEVNFCFVECIFHWILMVTMHLMDSNGRSCSGCWVFSTKIISWWSLKRVGNAKYILTKFFGFCPCQVFLFKMQNTCSMFWVVQLAYVFLRSLEWPLERSVTISILAK